MQNNNFPLIFERSKPGRIRHTLQEIDIEEVDIAADLSTAYIRKEAADIPKVSELEHIRHYTALSYRNFCIYSVFYPLSSCTMKYNPKINEDVARFDGFSHIHPLQDPETVQGALEIMYDLKESLKEITGMDAVSLQ